MPQCYRITSELLTFISNQDDTCMMHLGFANDNQTKVQQHKTLLFTPEIII